MIQPDAIKTVSDAWNGSTLSTFDKSAEVLASSGHNNLTAILLIVIAFFGIVMFQQVARSVGASYLAIFSPNRREEIFGDTSFEKLSFLAIILLLPVFSFVLHSSGLSCIGFWWTLATITALVVLRWLNFNILSLTVTGDCIMDVKKFSDCSTIILMTLALPLYFLSLCWGENGLTFYRVYLICAAAISVLPYIAITVRKIISARFSPFFAFLYLCALEIMPIAVAVKVLID